MKRVAMLLLSKVFVLLLLLLTDDGYVFVNAFSLAPIGSSRRTFQRQRQQLNALLPENVEHLCSTYTYCLAQHSLATQSATAGVFSGLGDALAQTQGRNNSNTKRPTPYDPIRTFHYILKGLGGGVMWSTWYQMVDPISLEVTETLGMMSDSTSRAAQVVVSIVLEQLLIAPLFFTMWDIPVPALLRGSPVRQIPAQVQSKLGPLLVANAKVWTPVNLVTYSLPPELRVLFSSLADLFWQSVNSRITSQEIVVVRKETTTTTSLPLASVVVPSSSLPQKASTK